MSVTAHNRREFLAGLSGTLVLRQMQRNSELHPRLYYSSATALAAAIRTKKISALEVANAYLKRIEEVNPKLNAVFQVSAERVQEEARRADAALARGQVKGPLHGVPMTIKDAIDTSGVISTAGSKSRENYVPTKDATVVARLRAAGAILLGKTNTPEFSRGAEADNLVYGRTNNPYDLSISPAGSSGGEGAILAAGGSAFGIGSDAGGSVRLPAYFCGIGGLKPTNGRVPLTGHWGTPRENNVIGPLARYVEDLDLLLPIIQGVDWQDPFVVPVPLNSFRTVDVKKLRVAFYLDNGFVDSSEEVQRAVRAAASTMSDAVARVDENRPRGIEEYAELYRRTSAQVDDFVTRETEFRARMLSFMETHDVIICPTYYRPPQPHGWSKLPDYNYSYTSLYNFLKWPAAAVRVATSSSGLPLGVQIVARPWRDDVALAVAALLESKLGGWKPPDM